MDRNRWDTFSRAGSPVPAGRDAILRVTYEIPKGSQPGGWLLEAVDLVASDSIGIENVPTCDQPRHQARLEITAPTCDVNQDGISDIADVVLTAQCVLHAIDPYDPNFCSYPLVRNVNCNHDCSLDIKDVVCRVRNALAAARYGLGGDGVETPPAEAPGATEVRFVGTAVWSTPVHGEAKIEVLPRADFGGIQFDLGSAGLADGQLHDVRLAAPSVGYHLDYVLDQEEGKLHGMLVRTTVGLEPQPVTLVVGPTSSSGQTSPATIHLTGLRSVDIRGTRVATVSSKPSVDVPAAPKAQAPALLPARPNPFFNLTQMGLNLAEPSFVTTRIHDVAGRLVRTLVNGYLDAGVHSIPWDGTDQTGQPSAAGIYYVRFQISGKSSTLRVVHLR